MRSTIDNFPINFTSKRCYVRMFCENDIDKFMIYRNDVEWMKYQGFKGLTKEEYRTELLNSKSIYDGIQLAIVCSKTDELIGDVYLRREDDLCWIGYTITPNKARQGYVTEILQSIIQELKTQGVKTIKAGAESENIASINLLKKMNFAFEGIEDGELIFKLNIY